MGHLKTPSEKIPKHALALKMRRTRAGMGRCQGTFCRPRVKALLARELGCKVDEVRVRADADAVKNRPQRAFFIALAKEHEKKQLDPAAAHGGA